MRVQRQAYRSSLYCWSFTASQQEHCSRRSRYVQVRVFFDDRRLITRSHLLQRKYLRRHHRREASSAGVSQVSAHLWPPWVASPLAPASRSRQLELDIIVDGHDSWGYRRQHARIQYFVDILRQYGEDENKRSLLKRLHVKFGPDRYEEQLWDWWNRNRGLFVLEPLAALTGIEEVRITSQWRIDWFTQCLSLRMRGDGGELEELEWPMKTIKRVKPKDQLKRPGKDTVSAWKTGSPTLDWLTYAQRNGIEVPADLQIRYPKDYVDGQ